MENYITVDWYSLCLRRNDFMRLFLTMYTEGENCRNKGEISVGDDGMSTSDYRLGEKNNGHHGARFGNPQSFDG